MPIYSKNLAALNKRSVMVMSQFTRQHHQVNTAVAADKQADRRIYTLSKIDNSEPVKNKSTFKILIFLILNKFFNLSS